MKKDNNFQITKADLLKIIKEEYSSMKGDATRAKEIQARLDVINEELETTPGTLSEVEAGGLKGVKSTGWTGPGKEDKKFDTKFEKIGTHLKEDEEIEGSMDLGGDEVEAVEAAGYFEAKFAELGKELDAKIGGGEDMGADMGDMGADMGDMGDMGADSGMEEVTREGLAEMEETKHEALEGPKVNPEALSEDTIEEVVKEVSKEGIEEVAAISEDTIEEVVKEVSKEGVEEGVKEEGVKEEGIKEEVVSEDDAINEDLAEPIEGSTPAQNSDARFNDQMDKDTHVKEGAETKGSILSEGFTPEKKTALSAELLRMRKLAKL